jgi:hypothetical protein
MSLASNVAPAPPPQYEVTPNVSIEAETGYEVVDKPPAIFYGRRKNSLTYALLETVLTGKALRVPRGKAISCRSNMYTLARREGLRFKTRVDGDYMIMWCEKADAEAAP